jgi:hypothetical protein
MDVRPVPVRTYPKCVDADENASRAQIDLPLPIVSKRDGLERQ